MRSLRTRILGAVGVLVLGAACGGDAPARHDALLVGLVGGDETFVPTSELPAGLHLRLVDRNTTRHPAAWVALYGDPRAEDPLAGDIVHVVYNVGSETGIGWRAGTAGERWVVVATDDDDQERDQIVVGGRGLAGSELQDLAAGVVLGAAPVEGGSSELRSAHLAEDDLSSDRVLLAEGPLDLSEMWATVGGVLRGGPALQWDSEGRRASMRVSSITADPATSLLVRSIVDDPDGTQLRGTNGVFGQPSALPPDSWPEVHLAVWEEAGLLTVAQSYGLPGDVLRDVVEHLRPSADDDWRRLVDEAEEAPPMIDHGTELASGSFDGGRWWVALVPSGAPPQIEQRIEAVDGRSFAHGDAGGCRGGFSAGHALGETGSLISGLVRADAAKVVLEQATGSAIEVTTTPLSDGMAFWNVWVGGDLSLTAVVAQDASGVVLQRIDDQDVTSGLQGGGGVCR